MASVEASERATGVTVSAPTLAALVVGSMVGAGVYSLPARFGTAAGVLAAAIAWAIAGAGVLMLALIFQALAVRKPELDAGVFAYAKAAFGDYVGFNSAFGYWATACTGNAFYWVFVMSTLGKLWPSLGHGDTIVAALASSAGIWIFTLLVARGVRNATTVNRIVTIAKIVPIVVFALLLLIFLDTDVLRANLAGGSQHPAGDLFAQVRGTMIVTVFVFIGVEGASVYSRYARRRQHVGRATVLGFLAVLCMYASVTLLSYGVLPREELGELRQPSMAPILAEVVGSWGSYFISGAVIVSVLGAYLSWTLMAAEVLFVPARSGDMPRLLRRQSRSQTPISALLVSSLMVQLLIIVTLLSEDALNFLLDLCTSLALIPYLLTAGYALKLAVTGETFAGRDPGRARLLIIAALGAAYTVFMILAAGLTFLLVSAIIYAPGSVLYILARREGGYRIFTRAEAVLFTVLVGTAIAGIVSLAFGLITI